MNKKKFILTVTTGLLLTSQIFASNPFTEKDDSIIDSVNFIEDDVDFELDFDTADYLPEGFNPYKLYIDLDAVVFLEEELEDNIHTGAYLPADFDAYAYPSDVAAFDYIDVNDTVKLNFDSQAYLPSNFDAYKK